MLISDFKFFVFNKYNYYIYMVSLVVINSLIKEFNVVGLDAYVFDIVDLDVGESDVQKINNYMFFINKKVYSLQYRLTQLIRT